MKQRIKAIRRVKLKSFFTASLIFDSHSSMTWLPNPPHQHPHAGLNFGLTDLVTRAQAVFYRRFSGLVVMKNSEELVFLVDFSTSLLYRSISRYDCKSGKHIAPLFQTRLSEKFTNSASHCRNLSFSDFNCYESTWPSF